MSVIRLLPAWLHAVADYAVGALLIIVSLAVGGSAGAVGTGVEYSPKRAWAASKPARTAAA